MPGSEEDLSSVLIVDDERELANLYAEYLHPEYEVTVAQSGEEALEYIDGSIDVVLLDRKLPEMSGDEVLTQLRARGYSVPVAMVTSVEPDIDIVDMECDEYITKPIDPDSLIWTVRVLANRSTFNTKSRELFRLISKKSSLNTSSSVNPEERSEYAELEAQISTVQSELHDTLRQAVTDHPGRDPRIELDEVAIQDLLNEVAEHTLPDTIRELLDEYQELQNPRSPFMWKWVHHLAPQNTLPCVADRFSETVPIDKTLVILFITVLDDTLEKQQDRGTFLELAKIPDPQQAPSPDHENTATVQFAQRIWEVLTNRLQQSPHYDIYADLFRYDIKQAITSIEYSDIAIHRPALATMSDLERYESHNMVMFAYADIDLMYSQTGMLDELGTLRDVIWTAQLMARIGNWISTWERELKEGDYSAGPIVFAVENNIVSLEELQHHHESASGSTDELIDQIKSHGVEKEFLSRWEHRYQQLQEYNQELSTLDLGPFIEGTEEVLRYHLASRGLK